MTLTQKAKSPLLLLLLLLLPLSPMQELCQKSDQGGKLAGLAQAMLCRFHAVGHAIFTRELPSEVLNVVRKLRFDPKNFTRIPKGNGREVGGGARVWGTCGGPFE